MNSKHEETAAVQQRDTDHKSLAATTINDDNNKKVAVAARKESRQSHPCPTRAVCALTKLGASPLQRPPYTHPQNTACACSQSERRLCRLQAEALNPFEDLTTLDCSTEGRRNSNKNAELLTDQVESGQPVPIRES